MNGREVKPHEREKLKTFQDDGVWCWVVEYCLKTWGFFLSGRARKKRQTRQQTAESLSREEAIGAHLANVDGDDDDSRTFTAYRITRCSPQVKPDMTSAVDRREATQRRRRNQPNALNRETREKVEGLLYIVCVSQHSMYKVLPTITINIFNTYKTNKT